MWHFAWSQLLRSYVWGGASFDFGALYGRFVDVSVIGGGDDMFPFGLAAVPG